MTDREVLEAIIEYCIDNDTDICPSVRWVCMRIGYVSSKEVWASMRRMEQAGILSWPYNEAHGRRGKARLLIKLKRPTEIPIIGYADRSRYPHAPGAKCVQITVDGEFYIDEKEYKVVWTQSTKTP